MHHSYTVIKPDYKVLLMSCSITAIHYCLTYMMTDRLFKLERLKLSLDEKHASRIFQHWLETCENFLETLKMPDSYAKKVTDGRNETEVKFAALTNLVFPTCGWI